MAALLEVKSMCFKFESQTHKFYFFFSVTLFFILTKLKSILSTTPAFPVAPETTWESLFSVVKPKVPRFTLGSLPFLSGKSPIGGAQEATEPLGQITSTSPAPPCSILAVFFQWTREVDPIQKRWRYGCRSSLESYRVKLDEEARWTMFMFFSSLQNYVTFGPDTATEVSVWMCLWMGE